MRGRVSWDVEATLGDFILLRSNGVPVYNFCESFFCQDLSLAVLLSRTRLDRAMPARL